jgi:hypothetical protein
LIDQALSYSKQQQLSAQKQQDVGTSVKFASEAFLDDDQKMLVEKVAEPSNEQETSFFLSQKTKKARL